MADVRHAPCTNTDAFSLRGRHNLAAPRIFYCVERLTAFSGGARIVIGRVDAEPSLAERLSALGIRAGERVEILRKSARGRVFYVRTQGGVTALGAEAARTIWGKA